MLRSRLKVVSNFRPRGPRLTASTHAGTLPPSGKELGSVVSRARRRRASEGKPGPPDDRRCPLARFGVQAFLVERLNLAISIERAAVDPGLRDRRRARGVHHRLERVA